jgi:hypothetical protein
MPVEIRKLAVGDGHDGSIAWALHACLLELGRKVALQKAPHYLQIATAVATPRSATAIHGRKTMP